MKELTARETRQSGDMKAALRERLDQNYKNFLEQLQEKTVSELIAMAPEITAAKQVREELLDACDGDDVEFLLRFNDPLEVVRGYWEAEITGYDHSGEMGHMLWEIRDKEMYSPDQLVQPGGEAGAGNLTQEQPEQDRFGLTETGLRKLQNAADPNLPHTYEWYVIENILSGADCIDHRLPLDEAIALYAGLDSADKRLGVTKDGIATVDLVICQDDREWFPEDWQKLASFAKDPVVAEAHQQIHQALDKPEQGMTMGW